MAWIDKALYWAWDGPFPKDANGKILPLPVVPTKRIDYVTVNTGSPIEHKLAIGVWTGDTYTPLNREELEFHCKPIEYFIEAHTSFLKSRTTLN